MLSCAAIEKSSLPGSPSHVADTVLGWGVTKRKLVQSFFAHRRKLARAALVQAFLARHSRARMANTFHGIFSEYIRPQCSMLQQRLRPPWRLCTSW